MKHTILYFLTAFTFAMSNCFSYTMYVNSVTGLNLREEASVSSKIVTTIPYGKAVEIISPSSNIHDLEINGLVCKWVEVKFSGITGYAADMYLFPYPAPNLNLRNLKSYVDKISVLVAPPVKVQLQKNHPFWLEKRLYKNVISVIESFHGGTEEAIFQFPNVTLSQGIVLLKNLNYLTFLSSLKNKFPLKDTICVDKEYGYDITIKVALDKNSVVISNSHMGDSMFTLEQSPVGLTIKITSSDL